MGDGIAVLPEARHDRRPAVVVTIVEVHGSSPREVGARMVVHARGALGTIGGGRLEHQATAIARAMLANGAVAPRLRPVPLGPSLGQCCGGHVLLAFEPMAHDAAWLEALAGHADAGTPCVLVSEPGHGRHLVVDQDRAVGALTDAATEPPASERARALLARGIEVPIAESGLLFEPFDAGAFVVALFGAGHVGRALVEVLAGLPCRVLWIDGRADQFPEALPAGVRSIVAADPLAEVAQLPPGAHGLVMTHSHELDLALVDALLRRADLCSLGLIGSATKRARFEKRLRAAGHDADTIARLRCPIGVPGIRAKHPRAIAIAVAAELLLARERAARRIPEPAREPA